MLYGKDLKLSLKMVISVPFLHHNLNLKMLWCLEDHAQFLQGRT